ncbi:hypothetical protein ACM3CX_08330 [Edwardsiella ictaluri]|uniref:hypothetical protein n=1 Tax=Edwardsiella ictaluri TaxID=67780 RepID=UPI0039F6D913
MPNCTTTSRTSQIEWEEPSHKILLNGHIKVNLCDEPHTFPVGSSDTGKNQDQFIPACKVIRIAANTTQAERERGVSGAEPTSLENNLYYLLTQALRSYQSCYQPRQRACGLRTSEARMLLVLDSPRELSMEQLLSEVAMPLREIGEAKDALRRKGWVAPVGGYHRLT